MTAARAAAVAADDVTETVIVARGAGAEAEADACIVAKSAASVAKR